LGLNDIDGFVLLDLLHHDPDTCDVPVYVISGAEQAEHALSIGASEVFEKPVANEALAKLFTAIAEAPARKARRKPSRSKREAAAGAAIPDLAGAQVLIVDDDVRNIYSMASVLETGGIRVLHAES